MEVDATTEEEPPPPSSSPPPPDHSALRLKSLAEEKYHASDLKSALKNAKKAHRLHPTLDGLSQMIAALHILRTPPSDHYRTLNLDPFSHINSIKKQYKSLALLLHPDKSSSSSAPFFPGAVDAFKRVGDAFRVLSDKTRRREYDGQLRVEIEAAAAAAAAKGVAGEEVAVETFWTACNTCRLFHEFDRRYLGQRLLCPSCRKSFLAVEVNAEDGDSGGGGGDGISRVRTGKRSSRSRTSTDKTKAAGSAKGSVLSPSKSGHVEKKKRELTLKEMQVSCSSKSGHVENKKRELTLKEMQLEALRGKSKSNIVKVTREAVENGRSKRRQRNMESRERAGAEEGDGSLSVMAVEDSDFYDFDKDRLEKSFRKGEVWAIYDDDDGMPRHYGLLEEVISRNPFKLKMCWLDLQGSEEESIALWEKMGFHMACGRFKLGKKVNLDSVNLFSHVVYCERAARELYRIYPKKGSVWALYSERTISGGEERCYDIVVVLTSYSEMYGLSMGYLEKVVGFKTIFQRREIGVHAIRWLEKDDFRLFSHQIPARKLTGEEGPNVPKECWELDPASLPADLLHITRGG